MQYVPLGASGLTVSRLCGGTLTVGPLQKDLSLDEGSAVLAHAMSRGITFFDTAQLYETYPYLREALRRCGKYNCVISSKTYAYTREMAIEAVEQARRELDRDYIDIFMLHEQESVYTLEGHKEALDVLYEYKAKGVIRAVGASMHHIAAVHGAAEKGLDVIHPLINVAGLGIVDGTREQMESALRAAKSQGIGVFSMKPLGGGNLFPRAAECLRYLLTADFTDAVAIGIQSVEEVDANIEFFETGSFSPKAQQNLAAKQRRLHIDEWCTGCGTCAARCPQQALSVQNGHCVCAHSRCLLCGYCSSVCPMWAIKVV